MISHMESTNISTTASFIHRLPVYKLKYANNINNRHNLSSHAQWISYLSRYLKEIKFENLFLCYL